MEHASSASRRSPCPSCFARARHHASPTPLAPPPTMQRRLVVASVAVSVMDASPRRVRCAARAATTSGWSSPVRSSSVEHRRRARRPDPLSRPCSSCPVRRVGVAARTAISSHPVPGSPTSSADAQICLDELGAAGAPAGLAPEAAQLGGVRPAAARWGPAASPSSVETRPPRASPVRARGFCEQREGVVQAEGLVELDVGPQTRGRSARRRRRRRRCMAVAQPP